MNTQTVDQKQTRQGFKSFTQPLTRWIATHPAALSVVIAISLVFILMSLLGGVNTGINVNTF